MPKKEMVRIGVLVALLAFAVVVSQMANTIEVQPDAGLAAQAEPPGNDPTARTREVLGAERLAEAQAFAAGRIAACWIGGEVIALGRIECLSRGGRLDDPATIAPPERSGSGGSGVVMGEPSWRKNRTSGGSDDAEDSRRRTRSASVGSGISDGSRGLHTGDR